MESKIINIFKEIGIEVTNIETADNSFNSHVYIVYSNDNKYIFKILMNEEKRINEMKYYNYLYNYVPTSKVIDSGIIDDKQYNIISFFEGKNLHDEYCNQLSYEQIYNMGKLLGNIHNCHIIDKDDDAWIKYLTNYINDAYDNLDNLLGNKDNKLISMTLNEYIDKNIRNNYKNTILHMDFRVGNVIFTENNDVGIIDLESMRNGDYAFDFVKMSRLLDKKGFKIFLEGYKSVRNTDELFTSKLDFYNFFDSYTSLCWCVRKNQIESNYYKTNNSIVKKYLRKIKNGKWNV